MSEGRPKPLSVSESQLITRALEGDPAAQRALYDAHVDRVYRLAWRVAGEEDLARDFTQETFVRAFDRLPILADALEDAGCTEQAILEHCRGGTEHVRGCWVVDLLTERQ